MMKTMMMMMIMKKMTVGTGLVTAQINYKERTSVWCYWKE